MIKKIILLLLLIPLVSAVSYQNVEDEMNLFDSASDIQNKIESLGYDGDIMVVTSSYLDEEAAIDDFYNEYYLSEEDVLIVVGEGDILVVSQDDLSSLTAGVKGHVAIGNYDLAVSNLLDGINSFSEPVISEPSGSLDLDWFNITLLGVAVVVILAIILLIIKLKKHRIHHEDYNRKIKRRQF